MSTARLPGVRFEHRLQPVPEDLPRMDIAAFVGFASSGPLHLPVAVEDPQRFREIFGPDLPLAWDVERGARGYAALGGAVEQFFANGGRRCWVVRVADGAAAVRHEFQLPGVFEATDAGGAGAQVSLRARAVGTWCESLGCATVLKREVRQLRTFALEPDSPVAPQSVSIEAGRVWVDLVTRDDEIVAGDLLEIFFDDKLPSIWMFVASQQSQAGFTRVTVPLITGWTQTEEYTRVGVTSNPQTGNHTTGMYWVEPDGHGGLEVVDATVARARLQAAGITEGLATGAPFELAEMVSIRRLTLDIVVVRGNGVEASLTDAGLAGGHPLSWLRLPVDEAQFASAASSRTEVTERLLRSVPPFPFAATAPFDPGSAAHTYFLPLTVPDVFTPAVAYRLPEQNADERLARDGLAEFRSALFVDRTLAFTQNSLLREAEHRYYVREQNLTGLHALLPVEEVALVAVPDAVQSGWTRGVVELPELFPAPELLVLDAQVVEAAGLDVTLAWTCVDEATAYTVQYGAEPSLNNPVTVLTLALDDIRLGGDGGLCVAALALALDCPEVIYFRVRALRETARSAWSNTLFERMPRVDFAPCGGMVTGGVDLFFTDSPPANVLAWTYAETDLTLPASSYELQSAANADFIGGEVVATIALSAAIERLTEARRFYRVRALAAGIAGPWSNTIIVEPAQRFNTTQIEARDYDVRPLLDVHRALLRFAAARGDFVALLSLPRHFRTPEAAAYVGLLSPGGERIVTALVATGSEQDDTDITVPPLTSGERGVLSFGTLVHSWISIRIADRGVPFEDIVSQLPPDGTVAGSVAEVTLANGAWIAAANRPLQRVLALQPAAREEDWRALYPLKVNQLLQTATGFKLLSELTLTSDPDLSALHVRRFMILLRRLALREGERFVFDNNDHNLRNLVRHRFEAMFAELYRRGAFAGDDPQTAYRVRTGASVNPPQSVDRGRFVVEIQVRPAQALTHLTVRLVADERGRLTVEES